MTYSSFSQAISRPYNLLFLVAFVFILISFLGMNNPVDLHFYDTYVVMNDRVLFWIIAALLMCFAVIYRLTYRVLLSRYLTWIHLVLTLLTLSTLMIFPFGTTT